jgi:hypothetical protein
LTFATADLKLKKVIARSWKPPPVTLLDRMMKNTQRRDSIFLGLHLSSRLKKTWVVGLLFGVVTIAAVAHAAITTSGPNKFMFSADGPAGFKIEGKGSGLKVTEQGGNVVVSAPLSTVKTGIETRDSHFRKALKSDAHPEVILSVKMSDLKFPADNGKEQATANGHLKIAGKEKPVKISYSVKRTGYDYHIQAQTKIDYTHFVEKQCYMKICVDPPVEIKAIFKITKPD